MSHAHAADLDDKKFNAKWNMLANVSSLRLPKYGKTDNLI